MILFPNLRKGKWKKIDFDEESRKIEEVVTDLDFTNPDVCSDLVDKLHQRYKVNYSWGGFLEDRSNLWKDHYQKESGAFVHLGVDYNVPVKTEVALIKPGRVVDVFIDKDQYGGWGGRITWDLQDGTFLTYGHLMHDIKVSKGQFCKSGEIVGKVGFPNENGGWYPHLHVQLMNKIFIDECGGISKIDGYLPKNDPKIRFLLNPEYFVTLR